MICYETTEQYGTLGFGSHDVGAVFFFIYTEQFISVPLSGPDVSMVGGVKMYGCLVIGIRFRKKRLRPGVSEDASMHISRMHVQPSYYIRLCASSIQQIS